MKFGNLKSAWNKYPGAQSGRSVKSKRDRAIPSTLLLYALRRDELCKLKVEDFRNIHLHLCAHERRAA
jgi:integrase